MMTASVTTRRGHDDRVSLTKGPALISNRSTDRTDDQSDPFLYVLFSLAMLAVVFSAAEMIAWLCTGCGEYWLIGRWIAKHLTGLMSTYPWVTILAGCLALICAVTAWAFHRARPGNPLAKALEQDPDTQAQWLRNTPR